MSTTYPAATSALDTIDELRALLPGQVTVAGDPYWDFNRLGWVVNVDQQPQAVVTVRDADDVVAVVRFARRHGHAVSAQPGGHGASLAISDTILLRTRALDGIHIDTERRVARVGAGVKFGELLGRLQGTGLTALAGSSPDTTVVGLSVGGGMSWFGRAYGLAADSLVSIDLVDSEGQLVTVTAESDPDLFWAVRGGGGDFGIITCVEVALHPAAHVYGGRLLWPMAAAPAVLRAFRDLTEQAPEELTLWAHLMRFPALEEVPEPLRGGSFVTVDATYVGAAAEGAALLAPLLDLEPVMSTLGTVPIGSLGDILAEPVEPMPSMERSRLLTELSDDTIDALLATAGAGVDTPLLLVQLRHLGGALARPSARPGAVGAVAEPYQLFALGIPAVPQLVEPLQQALGGLEAALAPWSSERQMFNFLGSSDDPSTAFTPTALGRLRAIKLERDPRGVIRSNRPVLAGASRVPAQRR